MRQFTNNILHFAANKIFPAFFLTISIAASVAQAAPQNGVIVGGQGSISSSSNVTNINQQSNSLVVDWSSFNVNTNESVNFNQPSSNAAALNRIFDQNPSQILGSINSNGRVFLSNPNGVIFGATATVNVGALMATSLSISKNDFMNGNYLFKAENYTPGDIVNRGILSAASGGSISLVGGRVVNNGYIVADYGQINLATGKKAVLNFDGDGLINFQVSEDILNRLDDTAESAIENTGTLQANGGQVLLDAHVAKDVFTNAINNEGVITAHRMENRGGEVYLFGNSGTTLHSGDIDVFGENGIGGTVFLLGDNVGLIGQAKIDASGDNGGGTVLIGGDYQGKNIEIQKASHTFVSAGSSISADAVTKGNGGKVIVWADDSTRYFGSITAKGGSQSGDGGFVEVSGKQNLMFDGAVDTSATVGEVGVLLLDPDDLFISNGISTCGGNAACVQEMLNPFDEATTNPGSGDAFFVTKSTLEALVAGTDVVLAAANDIIFETSIAMLTDATGSVSFTAGNDIAMTGFDLSTAGGDVTMDATDITNIGTIDTNGGSFTLDFTGTASQNSGDIITGTTSLTKMGSGDLVLSSANDYSGGTTVGAGTLTGTTTSLQGNITNNAEVVFSQATNGAYDGDMDGTGVLTKLGAGNVTLGGTNTYAGGTTVTAGILTGTTDSLQGNITNNASVVINQSVSGIYAGNMTGSGALTKSGNSNVTLNGMNSYSGGTTVSLGILTGNTDSLQGDILNNARVTFNQGSAGDYTGVMSGTGILTKSNTGNLTLKGANTYSGGTNINAGVLTVDGINATAGTGTIAVSANRLNVNNGATVDNAITVTTGTLGNTAGAGTIAIGGVTLNGAAKVSSSGTGTGLTISSIITETFNTDTVTKTDSGNVILSGANTYSGGTTISDGALTIDGATATAGTGTIAVGTGTLNVNNDAVANNAITITTGTLGNTAGDGTIATGGITLNGAANVSSSATGTDLTISSIIAETFNTDTVTKTGSGNVTLSGANTYSGGTTVSDGTLTGTTTSLQGNITNNAAVVFDQATTGTYSGAMSGSGNLTKAGNGNIILGGANTYNGGTTVSAGTLTGTVDAAGGTGSLQGNITNNANVVFNQATSGIYAGNMSGSGVLTKAGIGNVTLSGTNSYSSGTTVSAGILTGTTTSLQGNITNNATVVFDQASTGTYSDVMSGSGVLTKANTGNLILSNTNTYSGGTTISGGVLTVDGNTGQAGTGTIAVGANRLNVNNGATVNNAITVTTGTLGNTAGAGTIATGGVTLNGAANVSSSGTGTGLTISSIIAETFNTDTVTKTDSGNVTFTGANIYNGGTTISDGALTIDGATATAGTGTIAVGSRTLNVNNDAVVSNAITITTGTLGNTAGDGTIATTGITLNGAANVSSSVTGTGLTISSIIAETFNTDTVTKTGSGNVTLSGANTYSGGTTVSDGTLTGTTTSLQGSILNNAAVVFDQTTTGTYSGVMSGTGDLTKSGNGNVILSGANTYAGGTTVSAGTLTGTVDAFGGTGSLQGNITNNANVVISQATSGIYAGNMTGSGALTKLGNGNATLSGMNSYSGGTTVSAGILTGTTTSLQGNITNNASVAFDQASTGTYSDVMSGSGVLTKSNTGNLILSNTNTYSGGTTITGGVLTIDGVNGVDGNNGQAGTGTIAIVGDKILNVNNGATVDNAITISGGTLGNTAGAGTIATGGVTLNGTSIVNSTAGGLTISSVISGSNALVKTGAGTVTLSGNNSYTGTTSILAGSLTIDGATANAGTGLIFVGSNILNVNNDATVNNAITITTGTLGNTAGAGIIATVGITLSGLANVSSSGTGTGLSISSDITGANQLIKTGSGNVTLSGANTYQGTSLNNGTLTIDGATATAGLGIIGIADNTTLNVNNGATLDNNIGIGNGTLGNTEGTGTIASTIALTSDGTVVNSTGGGLTISSSIVDNGGTTLTKTGSGRVILSGSNSYTGLTTVSEGTLSATNNSSLGTTASGTTVDAGATLELNNLTLAENITLNGGLLDANGGSILTGTLGLTMDSSIATNGVLDVTGVVNTASNALDINASASSTVSLENAANDFGVVTISNGNNVTLVDSNNITIGTSNISNNLTVSAVNDITVNAINAAGAAVNLNAGTGAVSGAILDGNATSNNITANTLIMNAVTGIGGLDTLEIDVANLTFNNTGIGDIKVFDTNNVLLLAADNTEGEISISAGNNLTIANGVTVTTTNAGDINFFAGNAINGAGAFSIASAGGFTYSKAVSAAGNIDILTATQLRVTENITSTGGSLTLGSSDILFSTDVNLKASDSIALNASAAANGNLSLDSNGIDLLNALTVNNGDLSLNAGNDDLSITDVVTVNGGNLTITATDLEINPTGSIVGTDTVTISDAGNGMELGGTPDPTKLNISLSEYDQITAGELILSTENTLTLKETFQANTSTSPLTINANQLDIIQAGTVFGLMSNLNLAETAVVASADFTINVGGSFNMNNTIVTNGNFTLVSGQAITMGEPASITSNNNTINLTANGGDVLLGLADAGTGDVNVTASAGSVLNNNGVFADVTQSKTNIKGTNTTITASQRIGASSTDAITVDTSQSGLITLDFNAEKAFINNLQNTKIVNNGSGDVAVGLIFSGQIIGVGHNVGLNSQVTEEIPTDEKSSKQSSLSVLGTDYKLSAVDEEEEDSSTLNTVVPVMIRTQDGWEFKAPLRPPVNHKKGERKVDWL